MGEISRSVPDVRCPFQTESPEKRIGRGFSSRPIALVEIPDSRKSRASGIGHRASPSGPLDAPPPDAPYSRIHMTIIRHTTIIIS